jgi:hypothetical protein
MVVQQVTDIEPIRSTESSVTASSWIKPFRQRVVMWLNTSADYYTAAALYDELRVLSDAELQKRGLLRGTLARHVCSVCDRTDHS